jgi:TRAP-type C4-dicarboxylate transport system permease small subunit
MARPAAVLLALINALIARVGKWDVVKDAIADNRRTIRLCAILVAAALPPGAVAVMIALLAHHA